MLVGLSLTRPLTPALSREGEGVAMRVLIDSVNDWLRRLRLPFRTLQSQRRGLAQVEVGRFADRLATIPPLPQGEGVVMRVLIDSVKDCFVGYACGSEHPTSNHAVWPRWKWADSPTG